MYWIKTLHEFFSRPLVVNGNVVNPLDRILVILSKSLYLILRIAIRVLIGKEKRDCFIIAKRFSYMSVLKKIHPKPMLIKVAGGLFWCRIAADYTTDFIVISDAHEPWFLTIFKPKPGDIVLDLGAHIGRYSVIAGKLVGDTGKVIAVEADPDNYELLRLNIKSNSLEGIVYAINAAAWKEVTMVTLFRDTFSGRHSVTKRTDNHVKVNTITLSELVRQYNLPKIDWMKVDIEGAEYDVLMGAKDVINSKKIKFMLLEVHTNQMLSLITELLFPLYDINVIKKTEDDRYYVTARLVSEETSGRTTGNSAALASSTRTESI